MTYYNSQNFHGILTVHMSNWLLLKITCSCAISFKLDSRLNRLIHIFQIFINNLNLFSCCVEVMKLRALNLKREIFFPF